MRIPPSRPSPRRATRRHRQHLPLLQRLDLEPPATPCVTRPTGDPGGKRGLLGGNDAGRPRDGGGENTAGSGILGTGASLASMLLGNPSGGSADGLAAPAMKRQKFAWLAPKARFTTIGGAVGTERTIAEAMKSLRPMKRDSGRAVSVNCVPHCTQIKFFIGNKLSNLRMLQC